MTWRFTGAWPPATDELDIGCRYDSDKTDGGACDLELLGSSRKPDTGKRTSKSVKLGRASGGMDEARRRPVRGGGGLREDRAGPAETSAGLCEGSGGLREDRAGPDETGAGLREDTAELGEDSAGLRGDSAGLRGDIAGLPEDSASPGDKLVLGLAGLPDSIWAIHGCGLPRA